MDEVILKYALQNAIKFDGKANVGAVVGKIFAEKPETKGPEAAKKVAEIVKKVNSMSLEEQKKKLEEIAPELLEEKKEKKERDIFDFVQVKGNVTTAFPPEPSKYPHIGHAKSLFLNYEFAKKHKGKFVLRFEDTNPKLVKKELYKAFTDSYKWLQVTPDKVDYSSKHMKEFYKDAEKLIKEGKAYMCDCDSEKIRKLRFKGIACECRGKDPKQNMREWKEMPEKKEGETSLRIKIDMKHENTTMRDPTIMRIMKEPHPLHGNKYTIWPMYDFQTSIMDGIEGITHRFRSKEFEMRNELQRWIQRGLGYKETEIFEIGRFNLEGVPSSGRIIREMVQKKELIGWDDPSLTTIAALKRRGFLPEAIKEFVLSTGITKTESMHTWEDLEVWNRKLLDKKANRYFFIENPKEIEIKNAPKMEAKVELHPDDKKRGHRTFKTASKFYIQDKIEQGKVYRFMHLFNFKNNEFLSKEHDPKLNATIIHWLPANKDLVKIGVMMPDKQIKKGLAEKDAKKIKVGAVVQFERFAFCRLDKKEKDKLTFWYTHR
ncbi:MAG: glutamate--tRNA ligase [archaeon]